MRLLFGCAAIAFSLWAQTVSDTNHGVSLFDGKSLAGWHVAARPEDRDKGYWKVQDGAITCDSRGDRDHNYVWLMSDKEYGDFELRLKVRGFRDSTGNSGVQVRSRYDDEMHRLDGPQVDVHPPGAWRTGLIYDETRETRRWIYPSLKDAKIDAVHAPKGWTWKYADEGDGWNDLDILCRGLEITTRLNGVRMADFHGDGVLDDEAHRKHNVGRRGYLALQLHTGDQLYIQYKEIAIRELE
jgi:3-keto-disaccharide hydrolase